jgi:hypothetical protein
MGWAKFWAIFSRAHLVTLVVVLCINFSCQEKKLEIPD